MSILRTVALSHRWMASVFGSFVLLWILSGGVMIFVPFPMLTEQEWASLEPWDKAFSLKVKETETIDYDVWTVGKKYRPYRPFLKVSLDHHDDQILYWSLNSQQWVQETTKYERLWNYIGAIPHWLYLTALRDREAYWRATVWGLSLGGIALILSGLGWAYQRGISKIKSSISPARKWHTLLGIPASLFIFLWLLSGFFSLSPSGLFESEKPTKEVALIWKEGELKSPIQEPDQSSNRPPQMYYQRERKNILGTIWTREVNRLGEVSWISPNDQKFEKTIPWSWLDSRLQQLQQRGKIVSYCKVASDDFWISKIAIEDSGGSPPILRLSLNSPNNCDLDIDLRTGEAISQWTTNTRLYRILYRLFHTWDFPFLHQHMALKKVLMMMTLILSCSVSLLGIFLLIKHRLKKKSTYDRSN